MCTEWKRFPARNAKRLSLVVGGFLLSLGACESTTDESYKDIPDCSPCGWVLLELSAEPFEKKPGTIFHVSTRAFDSIYGGYGSTEGTEPGEYEILGGIPWGSPPPPGDTLQVWVVAVWHDAPSNAALVARDSVVATVRLRPLKEPRAFDTVAITLRR